MEHQQHVVHKLLRAEVMKCGLRLQLPPDQAQVHGSAYNLVVVPRLQQNQKDQGNQEKQEKPENQEKQQHTVIPVFTTRGSAELRLWGLVQSGFMFIFCSDKEGGTDHGADRLVKGGAEFVREQQQSQLLTSLKQKQDYYFIIILQIQTKPVQFLFFGQITQIISRLSQTQSSTDLLVLSRQSVGL